MVTANGTYARLLPWGLVLVGAVVAVLTFADYGPTPDDAVQATYGELALRYFATGGADTRCNEYLNLRFYGPLVEMLAALVYAPGVPGRFETRHLVLGLLALLAVPAVWRYASGFGRPLLPLFAVVAVCTQPRFYGHWFNNSKDAPFAVAVLAFMAALAWLVVEPQWRWRQALTLGLTMGAALCVRPGGLPLLLLLLLAGGALALAGTRPDPPPPSRLARLAVAPAVAWIVMVAPWPWAHEAPLAHPLEAMAVAARFPTTLPILFDGTTWQSDALPWYYLPKYVLIGTPPGVLLLAALGVLFGLRGRRDEDTARHRHLLALTLVWLLAPLALFSALRPNVYGGMRHFLFVLPALGILAACGAAGLVARIGPRHRALAAALASAFLLLPVRDLVRLHPYQTAYYNALVGGVAGAAGRYWTDYSLSSYREAIEWVNRQAALAPERRFRALLAAGPPVMTWAVDYAAPNVELVAMRDAAVPDQRVSADYYIGSTRLDADRAFPEAPIVHSIGRAGATFTVVKRLSRDAPG